MGTLSENDLYYLRSICRQLGEVQKTIHKDQHWPSIGSEILADNINWLDCFIEQQERAALNPLIGGV